MKLSDIKTKLGIPTFDLNTAKNEAGEATDWLRHWDNERRISVSLHKDTFAEIKADSKQELNLGLQHETRTGEQGDYSSYRIVKYTPAEFQL